VLDLGDVRRRRGHEQVVPRRDRSDEHAGVAGGVRHVRDASPHDHRPGAR
jgi:hypothetical protein